jgi:hypothetical protein
MVSDTRDGQNEEGMIRERVGMFRERIERERRCYKKKSCRKKRETVPNVTAG